MVAVVLAIPIAQIELEYVRCWSLLSDLGILARTIPAVLGRRGAH